MRKSLSRRENGRDKEEKRDWEGKRATWRECSLSLSPPWQTEWMGPLFSPFLCKWGLQSPSHPSLHRKTLAGPLRASCSHNPWAHIHAPSRGRGGSGIGGGCYHADSESFSEGHLHWAHIIKTFLIRCIALGEMEGRSCYASNGGLW